MALTANKQIKRTDKINSLNLEAKKSKIVNKSFYFSGDEITALKTAQQEMELKTLSELIKSYAFNYVDLVNEVGSNELKEEMKKGYTINRAIINLLKK